ncbi:MAG: SDR family NAD(P)-dependent oxidoreductase [Candidatus Caenarcaniphilales bacterium]|nr:SDR family NAD(P)-dependent oxidoreductase [Candidatus Caenarcaniphilales bacterium]
MRTLLTGATGVIGGAIVEKLSKTDYKLFLTGRNTPLLEKMSPEGDYLAGDLKDDSFLKVLIEVATDKLKAAPQVLILNAGIYAWGAFECQSPQITRDLLEVNLFSGIQLAKLCLPAMKEQSFGRIIMIGSISGLVGEANAVIYSASKAGLIGMTKALALEVAEYGITVNCINPGWIKTPQTQEHIAEVLATQKRWIEPWEIAELVDYLCRPAAQSITGQCLNLCAGLTLG